uniref:Uncharacterized protein n=1 Tax=Caenorhabditis japonica TaxID=281687 RepID=A0A8R1IBS3_CAEJA
MDLFNEFEISDDENDVNNEKIAENFEKYPKFTTNFHDKHWYRNALKDGQTPTAVIEIDLLRVADLFERGDFDEAKKILTNLRENTKNNRTHEIMLIDSILQCFIKRGEITPKESLQINELFQNYQKIIVDYGDQIQFLRTKAFYLLASSSPSQFDFKQTMALLCELCGSFDNWQIFDRCGPNLLNNVEKFGLKSKFEKILLYEIEQSRGFVKEELSRKLERIRNEKNELKEVIGEKEAVQILSLFHQDHHQHHHNPSDSAPSEFRAHESRSKNKMIPESEKENVIAQFRRRYPFFQF